MTKTFNVVWEERHSVIVEAETEEEAIDKVNEGQGFDDSSEITSGFEAYIVEA